MTNRRCLAAVPASICFSLAMVPTSAIAGAAVPLQRATTVSFQDFCTSPAGSSSASDNLVFDVSATAAISPAVPAVGHGFELTGLQVRITFVQAIAREFALVAPITGLASELLLVSGATPASRLTKMFAFIIHIPAQVPATGVKLDVPTLPTTSGPFTATSKKVVARLARSEDLTIAVGK